MRCRQLLEAGVERGRIILAGTIALDWEALRQGASILRVHDVREAADTVRLFEAFDRGCRSQKTNL